MNHQGNPSGPVYFADRHHAGRELARLLQQEEVPRPALIYALPRGGVPVAVEVALALNLPVELVIPRKIGHPLHPEYAIGAVTETGEAVCNPQERSQVDPVWLARRVEEARAEARRRRRCYRHGLPRARAYGQCAVLVDDGIATGLTMDAALREILADRPAALIVAVPVAPYEVAQQLATQADRFVAVEIPQHYAGAVGSYYRSFPQLSDEDVFRELARVAVPDTRPLRPEAER